MEQKTLTSKSPHSFPYRFDIEGLRAVAIIFVLLYHIFPNVLPGGFIGVDVFFVISGYLISFIIFTDLEHKKFKFSEFYIRRIKRIFPALLFILIFVSITGLFLLLPDEYVSLGKMIKATSTFIVNIKLWHEMGYFDIRAIQKPLMHLWSLSIEEQFYIFYPIFIYFSYKIRKFTFFALLLAFVISFFLNIRLLDNKPGAVFYLLSSRSWELLMGALLAYGMLYSSVQFSQKNIRHFLGFLGFSLLIYASIISYKPDTFPGWWALMPTVGTMLMIAASPSSWINYRILSHKIFVWIGNISYALYLWHWPLLSFTNILYNQEMSFVKCISVLIGSFVLAIITTFYIEKPIRKKSSKVVYPLVTLMIMMFLSSLLIIKGYIKPYSSRLLDSSITKISFAIRDWAYPTDNLTMKDPRHFPFYSFGKGKKILVFLGDSNIEQYWPRIEKLMQENPLLYQTYTVIFATHGGQVPIPDSYKNQKTEIFLSKAFAYLQDPSIYTIILGAEWVGFFASQDKQHQQYYYKKLEQICLKFKQEGKKVYLILNIPIINKEQDPGFMIQRHLFKPWEINKIKTYPIARWETFSQPFIESLRAMANRTGINVIDPIKTVCPHDQCIILDRKDRPIYKDTCHLNASYVRENAVFIDPILAS